MKCVAVSETQARTPCIHLSESIAFALTTWQWFSLSCCCSYQRWEQWMVGPAVEMINLFYNSNEALKSACAAQWSVNWMVGAFHCCWGKSEWFSPEMKVNSLISKPKWVSGSERKFSKRTSQDSIPQNESRIFGFVDAVWLSVCCPRVFWDKPPVWGNRLLSWVGMMFCFPWHRILAGKRRSDVWIFSGTFPVIPLN